MTDNNHSIKIKIGIIYASQERRVKKNAIGEMYRSIEEQINGAEEQGLKIMIIEDFNI